jgi:hypothetical protein
MPYSSPRRSPLRWLVATAAAGAAAAPLTGRHPDEVPYMGALFILLIIVSTTLAIAAISYDAPTVYLAAATACVKHCPRRRGPVRCHSRAQTGRSLT